MKLSGLIKPDIPSFNNATLMMQSHSFLVPFQGETLYAESTFGRNGHVLMLHGGGKDRTIFHKYRVMLDESGFGTTIFDFLGHGETGGDIRDSSLLSRTQQATAVMDFQGQIFTGCVGVSMGAYNALQLSKMVPLRSLILMVPGVYATPAYPVKFGPDFSAIIRQDRSWDATDAWAITAEFTGDLLVIAAENDTIIPADIPKKLVSSAAQACQKTLLTIDGAGHNSIWEQLMRSRACYESVRSAFERCLAH
ncbi:TPA: alpha/beta hydrolase [Citrobacter amalonaticus]|jgi:pimeloyl-ACP methyl ester carboxylesterase|uniref:Alpha/beta hydrolase n=3 Tax=Enterobacteriaceae TaxID=543 RepID=A0ABY0I0S3_CITAM|nr:alpha/beta hydrolase [Citrobacter amalonaticus]AUZ66457.1 alpha/beta hydrolase [Citrobacter sp. CFNIH10]KEY46332.1 hypothetical protein DQ02_15150 [Citrobacter amalonaticus]QDK86151.1 alpha/beta hydrolase [Citrobacter amalonaticus]RSC59742.1 alpha/beta hydrolase [Citrobacter amalonaticus]